MPIVEINKTTDFLSMYVISDRLYDEISCDGGIRLLPEHFESASARGHYFYLVKHRGAVAGFVHFNPFKDFWEMHMNIIKEFRKLVVVEVSKRVRKMFMRDVGYTMLVAVVPECFSNVLHFCTSNGFAIEGKIDALFTRNGKTYEQIYLEGV